MSINNNPYAFARKLKISKFFKALNSSSTKIKWLCLNRRNTIHVYLIRHTKPDIIEGLCYGQSDVPLKSSFGEEMKDVLRRVKKVKYGSIYSSPLMRCLTLAKAINYKSLDIVVDKRLMEMNFGLWELKNWDAIYQLKESKEWFNNYIGTKCPKGESYNDLLNRVGEFILHLSKIKKPRNVLVVCHAGTIKAFHAILNNIEPKESFKLKIDFGEIIKMEIPL